MHIAPHPLQWPQGRPRRRAEHRKSSQFGKNRASGYGKRNLSMQEAVIRLMDEFRRIAIDNQDVVVSSNVRTRLDGLPRAGEPEPRDPGVAVYFTEGGVPHCLPCDTYDRVADNIAAVAAHIEATRKIERHGVASVREMFTGFRALPPPGADNRRPWPEVLDIPREKATHESVRAAFRKRAAICHPDTGGSNAAMAELNVAFERALRDLENSQ